MLQITLIYDTVIIYVKFCSIKRWFIWYEIEMSDAFPVSVTTYNPIGVKT